MNGVRKPWSCETVKEVGNGNVFKIVGRQLKETGKKKHGNFQRQESNKLTALVHRCPHENVDADGVGLHIQLESVDL